MSPTCHIKGAFLDNTCSPSSASWLSLLISLHWSPLHCFYWQSDLLRPWYTHHFCLAFCFPLLAASNGKVQCCCKLKQSWQERIGTRNCWRSCVAGEHDKQSLDRISTCFLITHLPLLTKSFLLTFNSPGFQQLHCVDCNTDRLGPAEGIDICQELRPKLLTNAWLQLLPPALVERPLSTHTEVDIASGALLEVPFTCSMIHHEYQRELESFSKLFNFMLLRLKSAGWPLKTAAVYNR